MIRQHTHVHRLKPTHAEDRMFLLAMAVAVGVLTACGPAASPESSTVVASATAYSSPVSDSAFPEPIAPMLSTGAQWNYASKPDPMGNGTTHYAQVVTTNTLYFSSPYDAPQQGRLLLRTHPRWGRDVILSMERGQFLCSSYDGCSVLVRFDDGTAQRFAAAEPQDNSTTTLFVKEYARFLAGLKKSKRVRIAANVYQAGAPVFEFDVSDFNAASYVPPSADAAAKPGLTKRARPRKAPQCNWRDPSCVTGTDST